MKSNIRIIMLLMVLIIAFNCVSCQKRELDNGMEYYLSSSYYGVTDITFEAGKHVEIPAEHDGHCVTFLGDRDSGLFELPSIYQTLILPETIEIISSNFYYSASKNLQYNEYDNGLYLGTNDNPYFAFIKVKDVDGAVAMSNKLDSGIDAPEKEGLPPPAYVENPTDATSCVIHPDTKIIANNAFAGCEKLKSITIPGTIKVIPSIAFGGCTSLETVIIEEGVEIIKGGAFLDCTNLVSIVFPSTLKEAKNIFDTAYGNTYGFEAILSDGLQAIPKGMFAGCNYLRSVSIPDSVKMIGEEAFYNCFALESVSLPPSLENINRGVFYGCEALSEITIPNSVKEIGEQAFYGCKSLKEINFSSSLEKINTYAFKDCSALENINLPDQLTVIDMGAFWGCTSIKNINLPDQLTVIDMGAFLGCKSIKNIELPDSLRVIGAGAFAECSLLTNIHIPKNVESIDSSIIRHCRLVMDITVDPENKYFCVENGALYDIAMKNLIAYAPAYQAESFTIPESVQKIWAYAFTGSILKEIIIPEGVKQIGTCAFSNMSSLKCLVIPDSVISIDQSIVNGTTSLERIVWGNNLNLHQINEKSLGDCYVKELVIPQNVDEITEKAFEGLSGLESIVVAEGNKRYKDIDGNLYSKDGKTLIKYAHGKSEEKFTIPSGVVKIEKYAFSMLENLKEVIISSTVKNIADHAFSSGFNNKTLTSLVAIEFSDSVETIGDGAFYYCTNLKSIDIPDSVTYMGSSAFGSCSSLETAKVGNGIKTIDWHTFKDCTSLKSVELGNNVELIEKFAFSGCTNLTDIVIPVSVKRIEEYAFSQTMNFHYKGLWVQWMILQCNSDLFTRQVNTHYVYFANSKLKIYGIN